MENQNHINQQAVDAVALNSAKLVSDEVIIIPADDEEEVAVKKTPTILNINAAVETDKVLDATKKRKPSTTSAASGKKQPKLLDEILSKPTLSDSLAHLRELSSKDILLIAEDLIARLKKEPEDVQKELTIFRAELKKSLTGVLKWKPACKHGLAPFAASAHCSKEVYNSIMGVSEEDKGKKQSKTAVTEMHCADFWKKVGIEVVPKSMWGSFPVQGEVKVNYHFENEQFKVSGRFGC